MLGAGRVPVSAGWFEASERCGAGVRRQGYALNGAGALRRGVGALEPGGEAWPGVGGVFRGVGTVEPLCGGRGVS